MPIARLTEVERDVAMPVAVVVAIGAQAIGEMV
jgi:hypothetical protein